MKKLLTILCICLALQFTGMAQSGMDERGMRINCLPPSPATMNLSISPGNGAASCNWKIVPVTSSPLEECPSMTRWAYFSIGPMSDTIIGYRRKLERINCTTGAVTQEVFADSNLVAPPSAFGINLQGLNFFPVNGSPGWFYQNVQIGDCFKLTLSIENACGSASDYAYFIVDTFEVPTNSIDFGVGLAGADVQLFPNPTTDRVKLRVKAAHALGDVDVTVRTITGTVIRQLQYSAVTSNLNVELEFRGAAPGVYVVEITASGERVVRRVVIH